MATDTLKSLEAEGETLRKVIGDQRAEIERLRKWIGRINAMNDNPAHYSPEIDGACLAALSGMVLT